ncbi:hypothetical protein BK659_24720 [Pseudomonas brassicacearum]|uniref:Uncharacterized protein n=1 Tax=Pseudomonas brassicacearum TaxID=930166 RepID=A0A423GVN8_9PSED|nr:hypothetical protein BK659_24720 [Pseudomonas brassicacearum]
MRDPLTEAQQHRAHSLNIRRCAADHDRQAGGFGTRYTTGYRCIQPTHAGTAGQLGSHFPRRRGFQTGKIHQQLTGFRAKRNACRPEHHLAHHLGIGQAQHHQIGVLTQLGRRGHLSRPGLDQRCALDRITIPHRQ